MTINRGFTLIEILVVIVIIGITFGFALIAFGDFGDSKKILFSAEQLVNNLRLAQQQAQLETGTFGLRIDNTSYQILRFQNQSGWNPISNKGVFKVNYFPKNIRINLQTTDKITNNSPAIILNASGDMTSFVMTIGSDKQDKIATLIGKHNGSLTLSTETSK